MEQETFKVHPIYSSYTIGDKGTVNGIRRDNIGYTKPDGYRYAYLKDIGWRYVHRLVYETFVGPIPEGLEINHKDGNKLNNTVANLEATTHQKNIEHSYKVLKRKILRGKDHWNYGKTLSEETRQRMSEAKRGYKHPKFKGYWIIGGNRYTSLSAASEATGFDAATIRRRCKMGINGFGFEEVLF